MENFDWTEDEIASRIGASTLALLYKKFSEPLGARHIARWRELGITKMEVGSSCYDSGNSKQIKEIAVESRNQGVEIVSVHPSSGKFSSAWADGTSEQERRAAVEQAIVEGEAALSMGATILVCHFGTTDFSEKSVHELLDYFKGMPLKLGAENVGKAVSRLQDSDDLRDYAAFVDRINSDQFGMVVDTGHARDPDGINPFIKEGAAYEAISLCGPRVIHLHLHDVGDGADDHLPPMDGGVKWLEIFSALREIQYKGVLMFESIITDQHQGVLEKIAAFPQNFMGRYNLN